MQYPKPWGDDRLFALHEALLVHYLGHVSLLDQQGLLMLNAECSRVRLACSSSLLFPIQDRPRQRHRLVLQVYAHICHQADLFSTLCQSFYGLLSCMNGLCKM